jgi:hypothetical protein
LVLLIIESFLAKTIPEFQQPFWLIILLAFFVFGFSINFITLLIFLLIFLLNK